MKKKKKEMLELQLLSIKINFSSQTRIKRIHYNIIQFQLQKDRCQKILQPPKRRKKYRKRTTLPLQSISLSDLFTAIGKDLREEIRRMYK